MVMQLPTAKVERGLFRSGVETVAGIDEVGRGAWAGPVSVGVAVLAKSSLRRLPAGLADSKLLSPLQRTSLFDPISAAVVAYAVGHASPEECDELGMTAAQRLATTRALATIPVSIDSVIVDGKWNFTPIAEARCIIGADRQCVAVAAASVLAKVTRDALMVEAAPTYPDYRFERNKGYPSPEHRDALGRLGLTALHRSSWSFAASLGDSLSCEPEVVEGL